MRIVAVVNQKGGVGKTTTTLNLGHALARAGQKVALIDLDPQGHLSASLGQYHSIPGVDLALQRRQAIAELWVEVRDWCHLLTCGDDLAEFERGTSGSQQAHVLRDVIDSGVSGFDSLLIDCPPSSGMLIVSAVAAADDVLVPVAGDYFSLTGLARLMLTLRRLQPLTRPDLRKWVFMSRFLPRRRLSQEVYEKISRHFPYSLLTASISETAALAECTGAGMSIFEYRSRCKSAVEFDALAHALLVRSVVANGQEAASHVA